MIGFRNFEAPIEHTGERISFYVESYGAGSVDSDVKGWSVRVLGLCHWCGAYFI